MLTRSAGGFLLGLLLCTASAAVSARSAPAGPGPLTALRIVLTDAETLQVATSGTVPSDAPVVVLLSGPVGSAFSLRKVTDVLQREDVAVLVVDPLGMGASSRPRQADYSLTRQAERVRLVLDRLVPPRSPVILAAPGTSATIAFRVAASDTARVRGIVSIAGGPVNRQGTSGIRLALALAPLLDNALGRAIGRRRFASGAREQSSDPTWVTTETVALYLAPVERDLRATFRALKAMYDAKDSIPVAATLPSIVAPVRLIVGDKPLPNAPTASQIGELQRGLRHFRVDTVPNAGTMLQEEQAATVARIIREMVRR